MSEQDKVNILLVDDLASKLMSYEVILHDLGENLIKAGSAREALEYLLKTEIAVVLVDVCMPDLDGFQLATMIREHPRFQKTAIIFISAIQVTDMDTLRGYELGGVDYVPVPVIPAVLRAKVRVFTELYRKTRDLERLNRELEQRVGERTAALIASAKRLEQSEQRRSLALAAGRMGSWDWDVVSGEYSWDDGQHRILGIEPGSMVPTPAGMTSLIHPEDVEAWQRTLSRVIEARQSCPTEFRIRRPDGEVRWCIGAINASGDLKSDAVHVSGVTVDITDRKEAEDRQALLAREVDHRARNALAVVQSILQMSRAADTKAFVKAVTGRISSLARAHTLLSEARWVGADLARLVREEIAPHRTDNAGRIRADGPAILMPPPVAQAMALAVHELLTNSAKYGALSASEGRISLGWSLEEGYLTLRWVEAGGPPTAAPQAIGFGTKMIRASIERGLGGKVDFDWRPEGLCCQLSIPADRVQVEAEPEPREPTRPAAGGREASAGGAVPAQHRRVLLVEDESLVAMMMHDLLSEFGFSVLGPIGDLDGALAAALDQPLDAAVLDVNLNGSPIYPVADQLLSRGLPFVFITGYDTESIGARYPGVGVIQKPIDPETLRVTLSGLLREPAGAEERTVVPLGIGA